jgi:hypothetical protein
VQRRLGSVVNSSDPSSISYIESLKSRIAALEAKSNQSPEIQYDDLNGSDLPNQRWDTNLPESDTPRGPGTSATDATVIESNPGNELRDAMHEANYLSLSAMAEPTDRQPESNQGLSFSTLFIAAASVGNANPSSAIEANTPLSGPMAAFRDQLFSKDSRLDGTLAAEAFRKFLEEAPTSFPVMARSELEELYNSVVGAERDGTFDLMTKESPEKILLVRVGIALGLLLSPNYNFTEVLISELTTKAVQLMPRILEQTGDLTVVQCLTALATCSLYTTYGGSLWHLLGLAMTRCVSAGMHTTRVSDITSDNVSKAHNGRAFWALYILDTTLSTAMDRPFCLNDSDIMVSRPSTPQPGATDAEVVALRYSIQHAQLLRSIRNHAEEDMLCHFVNLCHWRESVPTILSASDFWQDQLHVRGLVELLKRPAFVHDKGQEKMMRHIREQFLEYAASVDHQFTSQGRAPGALDGHLVFLIGVVITSQPPSQEQQRCVLQCVSSLTILSIRYTAFQGFRNILVALQSRPGSREHLQNLMGASEIALSRHMQRLILGSM